MATSGGPSITTEGLVFGYDTGYPLVSGSHETYRFNKGEPTTNLITNSGTSNTGWVGYGWTGEQAISNDYSNTYEFTATNGWHNRTFDTGVTSGGTIQVTFEYKLKQQETTQNQIFVLNGTHLGSYTNYIGNGSMSFEWQTFNGTFTANADSKIAIGPRGSDSSGLTDIVYIRNLQVEVKDHATPFIQGTRSVSGSLIDLTKTTNIDVTNVSFNSNAQITFDGTNDYFTTSGLSIGTPSSVSFETVIKFDGTLDSNDRKIFHWDKTSTTSGVAQIRKGTNNGRLMYQHHDGTTWYTLSVDDVVTSDTYIHILVVHSNTTATMYKNGVQVGTTSVSNLEYTNAGEILIGYRANSEYWKGDIPIFRVYNSALSAEEVKQNYNALKSRFGLT